MNSCVIWRSLGWSRLPCGYRHTIEYKSFGGYLSTSVAESEDEDPPEVTTKIMMVMLSLNK